MPAEGLQPAPGCHAAGAWLAAGWGQAGAGAWWPETGPPQRRCRLPPAREWAPPPHHRCMVYTGGESRRDSDWGVRGRANDGVAIVWDPKGSSAAPMGCPSLIASTSAAIAPPPPPPHHHTTTPPRATGSRCCPPVQSRQPWQGCRPAAVGLTKHHHSGRLPTQHTRGASVDLLLHHGQQLRPLHSRVAARRRSQLCLHNRIQALHTALQRRERGGGWWGGGTTS